MGRKKLVDENFLKVKEAYLKNPVTLISQEYYDYLKKETGLKIKECYDLILKVLLENKFKK